MSTLRELLGGPAKRGAVVDDALRVLDAEVDSKGGFGGIAIIRLIVASRRAAVSFSLY